MNKNIKNIVSLLKLLLEISKSDVNPSYLDGYKKTITCCKECDKEIWMAGNESNSITLDVLNDYASHCGWHVDGNVLICPRCSVKKQKRNTSIDRRNVIPFMIYNKKTENNIL